MERRPLDLPQDGDEDSHVSLEKREAPEPERVLESASAESGREDEQKRRRGEDSGSRDSSTKRQAVAQLRDEDRLSVPGQLKRVRSEGCVLKRQQLICSSTLPITTCYHLGEVIGVGTWCQVQTAVERFSGLERVVKRVCKDENHAELPQVRKEIALCRQLDHPNIARLFETFEDHKYIYLVLEYCRGGDLLSWLHARQDARFARTRQRAGQQPDDEARPAGPRDGGGRDSGDRDRGDRCRGDRDNGDGEERHEGVAIGAGREKEGRSGGAGKDGQEEERGNLDSLVDDRPICSELQAARFMTQLLSALSYLHRKGIAHRDLKLENILLVHPFKSRDEGEDLAQETRAHPGERSTAREAKSSLKLAESVLQSPPSTSPFGLSYGSSTRVYSSPAEEGVAPAPADVLEREGETHSRLSSSLPSSETAPGLGVDERQLPEASADLPACLLSSLMPETKFSDSIILADFGLARRFSPGGAARGERATRRRFLRAASSGGLSGGVMSTRVGTLYYLSPFLLKGLPYDEVQSDMWAAGVILYMLISGAPPFEGNSEAEVSSKILTTHIAFKEPCWRHVSEECKDLIRRLLHNPFLCNCSHGSTQLCPSLVRPLSAEFLSAASRSAASPPSQRPSPRSAATDSKQPESAVTCDSSEGDGATEKGERTPGKKGWEPGVLRRMDAATTLTHPWFVAVQRELWAKASSSTLSMPRSSSSPAFHRGLHGVHGERGSVARNFSCSSWHVAPPGTKKRAEAVRPFASLSPSISSGSLCSSTSLSPSPSSASLASSVFPVPLSPSPSSASLAGSACGAWDCLDAPRLCVPGGRRETSPSAYIRGASPSNPRLLPHLPKSVSSPSMLSAAFRSSKATDDEGRRGQPGAISVSRALEKRAGQIARLQSTESGDRGDRRAGSTERGDAGLKTGSSPQASRISPPREVTRDPCSTVASSTSPSVPSACVEGFLSRTSSPQETSAVLLQPASASPRIPPSSPLHPSRPRWGAEVPGCLLRASLIWAVPPDPDQAAIFHCRFLLLLGATSWRRFAGLGPLQRALRTVVAREMEDELEVRVLREVFSVLDRGHRGVLAPDDIVWGLNVARELVTSECESCLVKVCGEEEAPLEVHQFLPLLSRSSASPDMRAASPLRNAFESDASSVAKRAEHCSASPSSFEAADASEWNEGCAENDEGANEGEERGGREGWRGGDVGREDLLGLAECPLGNVALPPSLRSLLHLAALTSSCAGPPVGYILPYLLNLHAFLVVEPPPFLAFLSSFSWPQWAQAELCDGDAGAVQRQEKEGERGGWGASGNSKKLRREGEADSWTIHDVVARMDTDGSGNIEFVEFVAASLADADLAGRESLGRAAFRYFDRSFDGLVSYRDLLRLLSLQPASSLSASFPLSPGFASSLSHGIMSSSDSSPQSGNSSGFMHPESLREASDDSGSPDQKRDLLGEGEGAPEGLGADECFLTDLEHVTPDNMSLYRAVLKQIQAVDRDKDGYITYDEFLLLM
ncbi:calcium dependent protein kinase CDPK8 [Toxoplasma gondii ME49]|uniref:non-specific serine/threonine protein kinase n=1 Tax=Toxoplasma gondii (strain ATCC 50611 / Me49) TaxID=508771 RepID=S8F0H0_TOXGM|nr:calcium dependent protein kinase CDPK8 [Toxoplasma gondii ME49]EPT28117.1 calcium dependent protein kinase CDPK8 [Toxoplasma gondii ME49]|eukprot:XP_018636481.1 calcium dependent protein kinase CDPK8 [Toxoplasma gondii ME49]